jgi:hypothetical protein
MQELIDTLKSGTQVLTARDIGIGTIHGIPGARHLGFGYFKATNASGESIEFEGGGAMRRTQICEGVTLSWCPVTGDTDAFGIMQAWAQLTRLQAWAQLELLKQAKDS